jgi:hypothetical protein
MFNLGGRIGPANGEQGTKLLAAAGGRRLKCHCQQRDLVRKRW